ncbi:hypothetical protein Tco_0167373 [Tanacetum coccineum]
MANKHSIMTREMVERFCDSYYIPDEVHPTAPGRDRTITQFPEGKVGVYTRLFDYRGYRIPLTKFFVLTRVLDLGPSVAVFCAFYTRMYSDGLFSFAKRSLSAPSCLSKPSDSIKNWADHFFWVDSRVFPIFIPLYTGGVLGKDPAPHLTARQEQAVQVFSSNKAPFRCYPECFLALVGLSPYYPFGENTYPAFEGPDGSDMGLLDYIRTADPQKVQAVEVQKGEEQVTLFDSIKHCFIPVVAHQASGSGSGAGAEVSAPFAEGNVAGETVIPEGAFLDLTDPGCDVDVVEKDVQKQPEKAKRKKLLKRSDPLPAKRLRVDHPSLASGTGGKTLASLRRTLPEGSLLLGTSSPADTHTQVAAQSSQVADTPVYTTVDTVTSSRGKTLAVPMSDVGGSSQPETSEESADSFYETAALTSEDAKRWYVPRWNITNDSLLDDGFSCRTLVDRICLGSEVRSRTKHELELKEKLRAKYNTRGVLLREKDAEIVRLKSLLRDSDLDYQKKVTVYGIAVNTIASDHEDPNVKDKQEIQDDLNIVVPDQVLEESNLHTSDKVEVIPTSMVTTYDEHGESGDGEQDNAMKSGDISILNSWPGVVGCMHLPIIESTLLDQGEVLEGHRGLKKKATDEIQRRKWDPRIKEKNLGITLRARKRTCFMYRSYLAIDTIAGDQEDPDVKDKQENQDDLNISVPDQVLEESILHTSDKVEETDLTNPDMVVEEDSGQKISS